MGQPAVRCAVSAEGWPETKVM